MKNKFKRYLLRYSQMIIKRDVRIFVVCLALSSLFWIILELSDSFTNNAEITVSYGKDPEGFILVNSPDTTFNVHIESIGFELLNLTLGSDKKFVLDLNKLKPIKREDGYYSIKVPITIFENQIRKQFGSGVAGKLTAPDSVSFVFDELISTFLPVRPTYSLSFVDGYRLKGKPKVVPDTVEVRGSKKSLQKHQFIETRFKTFSKVSKDKEVYAELRMPTGTNWISNRKVKIIFPVAQYTEATATIPVFIKSEMSNIRIKTFPNNVVISFLIPVEYYKNISDTMFRVEVFLDSASYRDQAKLIPYITKKPEWIENLRFNTEVVDYIILK